MESKLSNRDVQVLVGLYLAKFDRSGLGRLGFDGFTEAFNAFGYALQARPASLKNYRDEFDPYFPNSRKGWHQRTLRLYCKAILERFGNLSLNEFSSLVSAVLAPTSENYLDKDLYDDGEEEENTSFAQRLITGRAAENYFREIFPSIDAFNGYSLIDTTQTGCGFDFKLEQKSETPYLAVEVKGLREAKGSISLTSKEHRVAGRLRNRYYVFVARNFSETPRSSLFQDPLGGSLALVRRETQIIRINWTASIAE